MSTHDSFSSSYNVYIPFYKQTLNISGIAYILDFYVYNNYYKKYVIENYQEYRPDKIAYFLWGNQYLSWVLNEINYFTHGIKEYTKGRSIDYLEAEILKNIGIL